MSRFGSDWQNPREQLQARWRRADGGCFAFTLVAAAGAGGDTMTRTHWLSCPSPPMRMDALLWHGLQGHGGGLPVARRKLSGGGYGAMQITRLFCLICLCLLFKLYCMAWICILALFFLLNVFQLFAAGTSDRCTMLGSKSPNADSEIQWSQGRSCLKGARVCWAH